jgi:hypothetical protein
LDRVIVLPNRRSNQVAIHISIWRREQIYVFQLGSLSYTSRLKVIKLASGEILFSKGSCFLPHADIFEHMSGQISLTLFSCLLCHLDRLFAFQEPSLGLFGLLTLSKNTPYLETDTFTDTKITQTQCTQTQNTSKDYKTQT